MADQPISDLQAADPLRSLLRGRGVFDGVTMLMSLWMNPRSFRWAIGLSDSTGSPWVQGHALVARADVLAVYRPLHPGLPPGVLYCDAVDQDGSDPEGFDAWRSTHVLRYRPVADLA